MTTQPRQHQPKKMLLRAPGKHPSQVRPAFGAHNNLPGKARKPGKFRAGGPVRQAPGSLAKTADMKHHAPRIKKGVRLLSVNADLMILLRDFATARRAIQMGLPWVQSGIRSLFPAWRWVVEGPPTTEQAPWRGLSMAVHAVNPH